MDRRKKRTSTNQYMMYLDMMEKDSIFATGRIPRDVESNYLTKKWKELSDKLNTCNNGPRLTAEEWRKRLNDWKNTTRCKYRRSLSGEKDISLTSLEIKALDLFGKVPNTAAEPLSITLKSEKDPDEDLEHQRSESLQKELQAVVEEAICGDDDEEAMQEEAEEHEEIVRHSILNNNQTSVATNTVGANATTYRTIVVDNTSFKDDDHNQDHLEFITNRRHTLGPSATASGSSVVATGVQTMVTAAPSHATTVTKLINGEMPLKRIRTQPPTEQVIYEVKNASMTHSHQPRTITIHNTGVGQTESNIGSAASHHNSHNSTTHVLGVSNASDAREIARQLKRIADIKAEKLKFEVARFKFNNPGFVYHPPSL